MIPVLKFCHDIGSVDAKKLTLCDWFSRYALSGLEKSGVIGRIGAKKTIFREPRGSGDSDKVLHDYSKAIRLVWYSKKGGQC
jgi:hypothetical protein